MWLWNNKVALYDLKSIFFVIGLKHMRANQNDVLDSLDFVFIMQNSAAGVRGPMWHYHRTKSPYVENDRASLTFLVSDATPWYGLDK